MEITILLIAGSITLIFFIIGFNNSWKTSFWFIVLCFVAFVVSFQYTETMTTKVSNNSLFYRQSGIVNSAIVFLGIFFLALFVGIALYYILWYEKKTQSTENNSTLLRYTQSILMALVGWELGLILAISLVTFVSGPFEYGSVQQSGLSSFLQLNVNILIYIGRFFSPRVMPAFLKPWLIC